MHIFTSHRTHNNCKKGPCFVDFLFKNFDVSHIALLLHFISYLLALFLRICEVPNEMRHKSRPLLWRKSAQNVYSDWFVD